MFFRIIKKDLKRKKTMNIILLLFIMLATMFVASGLNNVITVINGTDYFLDKAGVGDYVIITMGDNSVGNIEKALAKEPAVKSCHVERVIYGSQNNIKKVNGDKVETKNSVLFQAIEESYIKFFDEEDKVVSEVKKGHAYVSGGFMKNNNLKPGDTVRVELEDVKLDLVLDGVIKDALLGSDFMGNTRFVLNKEDINLFLENENISEHYQGEIGYVDTDDIKALSSAVADIPSVGFDSGRSTIKTCYVMDMIVAFIILILSICLIIVSFVVLKFSISFTIAEEFREIGVMKAIGIRNGEIRGVYIAKYLILSVVGAVLGFFASVPFGNLLLKSVSTKMVLGNELGIFINLAGAILVVVIILAFAYQCTGKVKKSSPIDAIRSGQTGERYKKKTIYRIGKSHTKPSLYMAVNDVISSPKRFITIIISFFICTLFVLILVNTTATMKSPNLIYTFGTRSDLYVTDVEAAMKNMNMESKETCKEFLHDKEEELADYGMPGTYSVELQYKYNVYFKGKKYMLSCQQGMGTTADEYKYTEGLVPQNENEIAITPQISEITGAKIGDTITIDFGNENRDCVVTAYYQTMNLLGEVIRLHPDAPTSMKYVSSIMAFQITFTDNPSEKEIEDRKARLKELYNNDDIMDATEYCVDCIGVVGTMEAVQYLLLAITIIVVLLITILMERSFIADEKGQIAILKAIGFNDKSIIGWHTMRFGIVALASVIPAAILSIPFTKLCISPIFGMMGAKDIKYNINVLKVFVMYPGIVFIVTVLVAWITALYTRTIKSSDTANIE